MFETDEKKQLFANWLWTVANADGNITKEEEVLNNIGISLGLKDIQYKQIRDVTIDNVESAFLLRELFRISISDKDYADVEKKVINDFIKEFNIKNEIVSATEAWAKTYLENEKNYYEAINRLIAE